MIKSGSNLAHPRIVVHDSWTKILRFELTFLNDCFVTYLQRIFMHGSSH